MTKDDQDIILTASEEDLTILPILQRSSVPSDSMATSVSRGVMGLNVTDPQSFVGIFSKMAGQIEELQKEAISTKKEATRNSRKHSYSSWVSNMCEITYSYESKHLKWICTKEGFVAKSCQYKLKCTWQRLQPE